MEALIFGGLLTVLVFSLSFFVAHFHDAHAGSEQRLQTAATFAMASVFLALGFASSRETPEAWALPLLYAAFSAVSLGASNWLLLVESQRA